MYGSIGVHFTPFVSGFCTTVGVNVPTDELPPAELPPPEEPAPVVPPPDGLPPPVVPPPVPGVEGVGVGTEGVVGVGVGVDGVVFDIVMVIGFEVVVLPARSVATTVRV